LFAGGFLMAYLAPFAVYLVPIRSIVGGEGDAAVALGFAMSMQTMLVIAPRAIAAMPGVIRGALVATQLHPDARGPAWLVLVAAPMAALLAYLALVHPFQLTGSGFFVA